LRGKFNFEIELEFNDCLGIELDLAYVSAKINTRAAF